MSLSARIGVEKNAPPSSGTSAVCPASCPTLGALSCDPPRARWAARFLYACQPRPVNDYPDGKWRSCQGAAAWRRVVSLTPEANSSTDYTPERDIRIAYGTRTPKNKTALASLFSRFGRKGGRRRPCLLRSMTGGCGAGRARRPASDIAAKG